MTDTPEGRYLAHPDLSGFVRGEGTTDDSVSIADHVSGCDHCRTELVEVTLGHALLSAAQRTLPRLEAPPPRAALSRMRARRRQDPVRRFAPLAAAAVVAAVLTGIGSLLLHTESPAPTVAVPPPDQTAVLEPVQGTARGEVSMRDGDGSVVTMTVDARDLPRTEPGQFYYVWLFDPATEKMLPLGQIGPSGTASFEVSDSLVTSYTAIDVSLEDDDGDPGHSVTSVLRASYAVDAAPHSGQSPAATGRGPS